MVTNEEKKAFVKALIEKIPDKIDDITLWSEIHRFLMADTGGKLYKYREINENNLYNLTNRTLYGALPSQFNDPFDSRMGFDLRSIMEAKCNIEIDVVEEIIVEYLSVLSGNKKLGLCSVKNREAIIRLLRNEQLSNFYKKQMENDFLLEDLKEILIQNASLIIEILSTLTSDEDTREQLEVSRSMIPSIAEKINPEGKYTMSAYPESFEDYARTLGVTADGDEITLVKMLCQIQFPDKYLLANQMDQTLTDMDQKMSGAIDNMFRVISLATDCKNRLMWSHYADGHKGFCVEYDFGITNFNNDFALVLPVIYSKIRPKFPWKAFIDENSRPPFADIMMALLTKDEEWSYEREWRVLISPALGKTEVASPPITGIYLGSLCSEEHKQQLSRIANKLGVPLKQMVVDRGSYNLHTQLVNL